MCVTVREHLRYSNRSGSRIDSDCEYVASEVVLVNLNTCFDSVLAIKVQSTELIWYICNLFVLQHSLRGGIAATTKFLIHKNLTLDNEIIRIECVQGDSLNAVDPKHCIELLSVLTQCDD